MKQKLWRAAVGAVLCAVLSFGSMATVNAASVKVQVRVDGILKTNLTSSPYVENGVTMVGINDIALLYGAQISWDAETRAATTRFGTRTIVLTDGSDIARVNYSDVKMPAAAVVVPGGRMMVPLRFVSETFRMNVEWDAKNYVVEISTDAGAYSVLALPAYKVENPVNIKYEEALQMINDATSSLKDIEYSLKTMEENKKDLDEVVEDVYDPREKEKNHWSMNIVDLVRQQRTLENQIRSTYLNVEGIKRSNELSLRNTLKSIEDTRLNIFVLEKSIELAETKLANSELKLSLGLETEANVKAERLSLEQSKSNLNSLILQQENNQLALNNQLGVEKGKNAVVTGVDVFAAPAVDNDLDAFIASQMGLASAVVSKALTLDNAQFKYDSYYNMLRKEEHEKREKEKEPTKNERDMENDLQSKQREYADAKTALEKTIRDSYSGLQQLEEAYDALQIDLQTAIDNYERVLTNYFAGMATTIQTEQAKLGILSVESSIQKNRLSYAAAAFAFLRP